jgi:AbrB family looped-hinge helix DNA binding protein
MKIEMARITSKGQITLPVAIRRKLNLKTGDQVFFIEDGNSVHIVNASALSFVGMPGPGPESEKAQTDGKSAQTEIRPPPTDV